MIKVLIVMLLVTVLSLTLAGPVLADKGGDPNGGNSWWGEFRSEEPQGERMGQGPGMNMSHGRLWGHEPQMNVRDAPWF